MNSLSVMLYAVPKCGPEHCQWITHPVSNGEPQDDCNSMLESNLLLFPAATVPVERKYLLQYHDSYNLDHYAIKLSTNQLCMIRI